MEASREAGSDEFRSKASPRSENNKSLSIAFPAEREKQKHQ